MLIRCIFEYFQKKKTKVSMINVINSNINVKMLLLVFIYKSIDYNNKLRKIMHTD